MKKTYIQPSTVMEIMGTVTMICGSDDITSSHGIDYGGVDEDGSKDPASRRRRRHDVWDDEEEEEEMEY